MRLDEVPLPGKIGDATVSTSSSDEDQGSVIRPGNLVRIILGPDKGRRARVTSVSGDGVIASIVSLAATRATAARNIVLTWDAFRPTAPRRRSGPHADWHPRWR